jgi:ankyrin repeat protein
LHEAAERGDVTAIESFADRPEFINAQDAEGMTAVCYAACKGKVAAVKALGALGADVRIPMNTSATSRARQNHERALRNRHDVGTPGYTGATPLLLAAFHGHDTTIEALVSLGASVATPDKDECTCVFYAAQEGHDSTVRLLASLGASVTTPRKHGATPVLIAAERGMTRRFGHWYR